MTNEKKSVLVLVSPFDKVDSKPESIRGDGYDAISKVVNAASWKKVTATVSGVMSGGKPLRVADKVAG